MQSKYLPANPSLEHLKSQAKKLQSAYQRGKEEAFGRLRSFYPPLQNATDAAIRQASFSLQDAQWTIAREYGFESWPKLKAHIETPHRATILIIDDNAPTLSVLSDILQPAGFKVVTAFRGKEGFALALKEKPNLIILDVLMPEWDGFETCRQLKQNESVAHIPVIFISSISDQESIIEGFRLGGVDYIKKPLHREEVLSRVNTHLKIARLTHELLKENRKLSEANKARVSPEQNRRPQSEPLPRLKAAEKQTILETLEEVEWDILTAAELLGISQRVMYRKLIEFDLSPREK